jgi:hypothetical protein
MNRSTLLPLLVVLCCAACKGDDIGDPSVWQPIMTPLEAIPMAELGPQRVLLERHYERGPVLYLIDPATQTSTIVASDPLIRGASLSPSGGRVAYTAAAPQLDNGYDLYVFDIGAPHLRLTATPELEGMPSWDTGTSIVFPKVTAAFSSINRLSPATILHSTTQLFFSPASGCPRAEWARPVHRSTGGDILIACGASLWSISFLGQATELYTTTLATEVHAPRWSPDRSALAFLEPRGTELMVRLRATADGAVTTLASVPSAQLNLGLHNIYSLCWAADGSRLLFTAPVSLQVAHLWTVRSDGTGLTQITTAAAFDHNVSCAELV